MGPGLGLAGKDTHPGQMVSSLGPTGFGGPHKCPSETDVPDEPDSALPCGLTRGMDACHEQEILACLLFVQRFHPRNPSIYASSEAGAIQGVPNAATAQNLIQLCTADAGYHYPPEKST